ncbi:MAG: ABC transporter substrate-binding protein [Vicinamibacterales bacterium]
MRISGTIAGLLVLSLASLAMSPPQATDKRADTVKVRTTPYLGFAPFFIARAERFFVDEGLDVQFVDMTAAAEALAGLVRGDLDVVSGAISPGLFNAIARGADIRLVASQTVIGRNACTYVALMASHAVVQRGALNGASGLRGLRIGTRESFATAYFAETVLKTYGLTMAGMQTVDVPESIAAEALKAGRIDLAIIGEPWLTRAAAANAGVIWKQIEEVIPGFDFSVVLYGSRLLNSNPDVGRRFMTAYLRGARQFNMGKTQRNMEILSAETGLDRDQLTRSCWPSVRGDGVVNVPSVLAFQAWTLGRKAVDRSLSLQQIHDGRFVEHANKARPAAR